MKLPRAATKAKYEGTYVLKDSDKVQIIFVLIEFVLTKRRIYFPQRCPATSAVSRGLTAEGTEERCVTDLV